MLSMGQYKENLRKCSNSNFTKILQIILLGSDWGKWDLKEVRFMAVLLDDGIYGMPTPLWILIFDF